MYYEQVNDIYLVSRMGQIIKVQLLYHRPLLATCISGLYYRPVCYIRGHIYNNFAGGIIAQILILFSFKVLTGV
jgi:hypothetical protein